MYLPPAVRASLLAQRDRNLNAVRERRQVAYFQAQSRAEIRDALRLIAEHKLRGVLVMPRDVEELADEIRQAGVAVVIGPVKPQDAERTTLALAALAKSGVPVAFGGEPTEMRTSAAWLVNAGLPRQLARRALIGQPAEAIGLPANTGRLVAGDSADFVIWTGDPLDTTNRPAAVVTKGQRIAIGAGDDEPTKTPGRPGAAPTRPRGRVR
jgi:imidazolonepropionase-like amidohydrolase